jgi:hypothetical protein
VRPLLLEEFRLEMLTSRQLELTARLRR